MPELKDGETFEIQGSAAKPYVLKNVGGVYSCTCPAWRNQSVGIEQRTCKHLRKLRGEDAEKERIGGDLPAPARKRSTAKKDAPPVLLAQSWDNATDLTDWWISEKLDGVRAYWDGKRFLSRLGNLYHAPDWFISGFPAEPLDGELWIDRQAFQRTVSIVRRQDKSDHWKEVKYVVFDAPSHTGTFEERIEYLSKTIKKLKSKYVSVLEQYVCKNTTHLKKELKRVEKLGGEGLMLRQPGSNYVAGRSWTLLKVKTFHDAEAIVVGHVAGKGKHKGRLGALNVRLPNGTDFSVGTGFSDKQRENPPELGTVIMFRYQELSNAGVPRFPSFVRKVTGEKADAILKEAGFDSNPKKKPTKTAQATNKSSAKKPAKKSAKKEPVGKRKTKTSAKDKSNASRYFELVDEKSSKFWEIRRNGSEVSVRYGRIGTDGTTKPKDLGSDEKAQKHYDKLIAQKTGKGYIEK